jgi:hypothetical protein
MYLYRGKVYVTFNGSSRVRLAAIFLDSENGNQKMVRLADLRPPGGTFTMTCSEFEHTYCIETDEVILPHQREAVEKMTSLGRPKTAEKYKRQDWNPYDPRN